MSKSKKEVKESPIKDGVEFRTLDGRIGKAYHVKKAQLEEGFIKLFFGERNIVEYRLSKLTLISNKTI